MNNSRFKPEGSAAWLILSAFLLMVLVFIPGCCADIPDFISTLKNSIVPAGEQEPPAKPGNEDYAAETETTQPQQLPDLKIYIENIIDYDLRNRVLSLFRKSFEDYNLAAQGGGKISGWELVFDPQSADIVFEAASAGGGMDICKEPFYYVLATSFFSLIEDITWDEFMDLWKGKITGLNDIEGNSHEVELVTGSAELDILQKCFGNCGASNLKIMPVHEITRALHQNENAIAIMPFESINRYQKIIKIDGLSVFDKSMVSGAYPLVVSLSMDFKNMNEGYKNFERILRADLKKNIVSNRVPEEMVTVLMTGVTALTRQIAAKMDENGITYPAEKIREILLDADITHISNEVSFVQDCYAARPNTMVFCSKPEYIDLLKYIDTDVIELTGNHLNDYGSEWLEYTIDMYDDEKIKYYGGGKNIDAAIKPALFEINGCRFAFIGANSFGPSSDWATKDSAGSAPINTLSEELKEEDMKKYEELVGNLKKDGYIVIFTFQYLETYNYFPTGQQISDFERMLDAGAVIVSGSQAHQPQGVEITDSGFINFGLGNIFFGQALGKEVKQGLIAKHVFYMGNHINTDLITTYIEDFSQPRPTGSGERADLLKAIFEGSIR
ncbi:MAG: CapA family protein [Actinobacteria bacterium]|nr:CapA family protein [Actinomycetota bacterium]